MAIQHRNSSIFAAGSAAVGNASARTRRFLRLALVKAAMDNCNAKADGKCLRYRKTGRTGLWSRRTLSNRLEHTLK